MAGSPNLAAFSGLAFVNSPWHICRSGTSIPESLFQKYSRLGAVVARRERFLVLPDTVKSNVVLKVPSDAWKMLHDRDAEALQFGFIADTRLHEHLRRVNRAEREHYLDASGDAVSLAVVDRLHSSDSLAVERQPRNKRMSEYRQVRPVHARKRIRTEHRLALSFTDPYIHDRGTTSVLHHAAVLMFKGGNPNRAGSHEQGRSDRIGAGRGLDKHRPACTPILWVRRPVPIFDPPINI